MAETPEDRGTGRNHQAEKRRTDKAIQNLTKAPQERKANRLNPSSLPPSAPPTDPETTNQ